MKRVSIAIAVAVLLIVTGGLIFVFINSSSSGTGGNNKTPATDPVTYNPYYTVEYSISTGQKTFSGYNNGNTSTSAEGWFNPLYMYDPDRDLFYYSSSMDNSYPPPTYVWWDVTVEIYDAKPFDSYNVNDIFFLVYYGPDTYYNPNLYVKKSSIHGNGNWVNIDQYGRCTWTFSVVAYDSMIMNKVFFEGLGAPRSVTLVM